MSKIANTPDPPYYAVIFTAIYSANHEGYPEMAAQMRTLVDKQPGFLGYESATEDLNITISYWQDLNAIANWKEQIDHQKAQQQGRALWYSAFKTRIAKVERDITF